MNHRDSCHVDPLVKPFDPAALASTMTAYLMIEGMGCRDCALRVRNGLLGVSGVLSADVILDEKRAAVAYDPRRLIPDRLLQGVANSGHDGRHHYRAEITSIRPTRDALSQVSEQRVWKRSQPAELSSHPGGVCCECRAT